MDNNKYNFLTTYTKDYVQKSVKLLSRSKISQEFANPINEGFKQYLLLDETDLTPPNENAETYLKKFKDNYEKVGKMYFQGPIRKDPIIKSEIERSISEYRAIYCDIEKEKELSLCLSKEQITLAEDAKLPLTTYTSAFRKLSAQCVKDGQRSLIKSRGNLKALETLCANPMSEYTDHIGQLGGFIVEENFSKFEKQKHKLRKN